MVLVGDFNTPLSKPGNTWKITEDTEELNDIMNRRDRHDFYRTLHPTAAECTFFSSAQGTCRQTTSWAIKQTFTISKELELYRVCSVIIIGLNQKAITKIGVKSTGTWKVDNTFLNNP